MVTAAVEEMRNKIMSLLDSHSDGGTNVYTQYMMYIHWMLWCIQYMLDLSLLGFAPCISVPSSFFTSDPGYVYNIAHTYTVYMYMYIIIYRKILKEGLMGRDHGHPYILSTTVLSDIHVRNIVHIHMPCTSILTHLCMMCPQMQSLLCHKLACF